MINKSYSSLTDKEAASGAVGALRGWGFASFLLGAFSFIIGVAALPLRLVLRKNIGERSVRPFAFILSIALHIYYFTIFDSMIAALAILGVDSSVFEGVGYEGLIYLALFALINPYTLLLLWAVRMGVLHFKQKIKEAQEGKTGYTYYRGESRYFVNWDKPSINGFETNEDSIRALAEPKAVAAIALTVSLLSAIAILILIFLVESKSVLLVASLATIFATGLVVFLDAICLAIDEISLVLGRRDKVLDMLDSEEDANTLMGQKDEMQDQRAQAGSRDSQKEPAEDNDFVDA